VTITVLSATPAVTSSVPSAVDVSEASPVTVMAGSPPLPAAAVHT
jgi:hypothetical protein